MIIIKLEQLKHLQVVAKAGSISFASKQLFITQQALSKSLKTLEHELNTQLLIRTNRGVALTAEGKYVLANAEQIFQIINTMEHHFLPKEHQGIKGSLKIMAIPFIRDYLLPKHISSFYKYYPLIDITLTLGEEVDIISALKTKQIDLGFCNMIHIENKPLSNFSEPLVYTSFSKHYFTAMLSTNSPLAEKTEVTIEQLLNYPIILMPDSSNIHNFNPYKIFSYYGSVNLHIVDNLNLLAQLVEDNLGVSLALNQMHYKYANNDNPNIVYRKISNNVYGASGYIYNRNHLNNLCLQLFLKEFNSSML